MKIVSITMVNNESEIIESFIRYNYNFIDHMIIIDNGCTDNTCAIINKLINDEKINISLFDESLETYQQRELENKYLNYAVNVFHADMVIPLDADEFLINSNGNNPRKILEELPLDRVYYINWQWYVLTGHEDMKENFVPRKLLFHLRKSPWDYSTGKPVTKVIIPGLYCKQNCIMLSMGHHYVFGKSPVKIEYRDDLKLAHYRIISFEQTQYKSLCYSIRDIATMSINTETAQRTNQVALLKNRDVNLKEYVVKSSYCGYDGDIVEDPIDLKWCNQDNINIKYSSLMEESIVDRVVNVSREMAIKTYNLELKNQSKRMSILFWMDGVRGENVLFPNPSSYLNKASQVYNTWGFVSDIDEISFLKWHHRLIVPINFVKFIPHKYIVIPLEDRELIRKKLITNGIPDEQILDMAQFEDCIGTLLYWNYHINYLKKKLKYYIRIVLNRVKLYGIKGMLPMQK